MIHEDCNNANPFHYSNLIHTVAILRNVLFKLAVIKKNFFNQYKNSIVKSKIILMLYLIIEGQADDQPRIGNYFLVNSINLCWS